MQAAILSLSLSEVKPADSSASDCRSSQRAAAGAASGGRRERRERRADVFQVRKRLLRSVRSDPGERNEVTTTQANTDETNRSATSSGQVNPRAADAADESASEAMRVEARRPRSRAILDYSLTALAAVVLALAIQAFIVKPYMIPSVSMANTLLPGQRVLVDRLVYHYRSVHRGDVIVFRWPEDPGQPLIKRIVGVPGDRLSIVGGRLLVNGRPLREGYVKQIGGAIEPTMPSPGGAPGEPWSLQAPYTVPAGHYFVMGDNRTDSNDSRYWGTVPQENIIGRAFFVYWPPGHFEVL